MRELREAPLSFSSQPTFRPGTLSEERLMVKEWIKRDKSEYVCVYNLRFVVLISLSEQSTRPTYISTGRRSFRGHSRCDRIMRRAANLQMTRVSPPPPRAWLNCLFRTIRLWPQPLR